MAERRAGGQAVQQMRAIGCRKFLLRQRFAGQSRPRQKQVTTDDFDFTALDRAAAEGLRSELSPSEPDGVVLVECTERPAVKRLRDFGIEPCCVVRVGNAREVWIRLVDAEEARERDRRKFEFELTLASRRLAAIAGGDPRQAHWQRGGTIHGLPGSTGEIGRLEEAEGGVAAAGADVMREAAGLAEQLLEAKDLLAKYGLDPVEEVELLAQDSQPPALSREVYDRHAAIARAYGVVDMDQIDASVVRAAIKVGARPERLVSLIRNGSPGLKDRHADQTGYIQRLIASVAASPDVTRHLERTARRVGRTLGWARTIAEASEDRVDSVLTWDLFETD